METTLMCAIETISILAAVLTLGAVLGGIIGYVVMYRADRKRRLAIHDRNSGLKHRAVFRLHTEPVAMIDTQAVIRRAVQSDRSQRSRKGWQARKAAQLRDRKLQQDHDIRVLIGSDGGAR
jgi:hypothetical protein